MPKKPSIHSPTPPRNHPAREEVFLLLERLENEPSHTRHVAMLSLSMLHQLQAHFSFPEQADFLLESAALLHDIGWSQSPDGRAHHKHSARLILQHSWQHLQDHERHLIALIARYHRKSLPKRTHTDYTKLSSTDRKTVRALASILRIADALDRTHMARVRSVTITVSSARVLFQVQCSQIWKNELLAFEKKKDLFEKHFKTEALCLPASTSD